MSPGGEDDGGRVAANDDSIDLPYLCTTVERAAARCHGLLPMEPTGAENRAESAFRLRPPSTMKAVTKSGQTALFGRRPAPIRDGTGRDGTARHGTARHGMARHGKPEKLRVELISTPFFPPSHWPDRGGGAGRGADDRANHRLLACGIGRHGSAPRYIRESNASHQEGGAAPSKRTGADQFTRHPPSAGHTTKSTHTDTRVPPQRFPNRRFPTAHNNNTRLGPPLDLSGSASRLSVSVPSFSLAINRGLGHLCEGIECDLLLSLILRDRFPSSSSSSSPFALPPLERPPLSRSSRSLLSRLRSRRDLEGWPLRMVGRGSGNESGREGE